MTKKSLMLCGELVLCCQEGGYADDAFEVDGERLDGLVRDYFGIDGYDPHPYASVGRVRITIEPLAGTSNLEMSEEKLLDHINQRLQVMEKTLLKAADYQEFRRLEAPAKKLRNARALLKRGNMNGAWALLETNK